MTGLDGSEEALLARCNYRRWHRTLLPCRGDDRRHFEPALVELFVSVLPKVVEVRERFLEEEEEE